MVRIGTPSPRHPQPALAPGLLPARLVHALGRGRAHLPGDLLLGWLKGLAHRPLQGVMLPHAQATVPPLADPAPPLLFLPPVPYSARAIVVASFQRDDSTAVKNPIRRTATQKAAHSGTLTWTWQGTRVQVVQGALSVTTSATIR